MRFRRPAVNDWCGEVLDEPSSMVVLYLDAFEISRRAKALAVFAAGRPEAESLGEGRGLLKRFGEEEERIGVRGVGVDREAEGTI